MKKKTRAYVNAIVEACEIAQQLPLGYASDSPTKSFTQELWDARDRFFGQLMAELPKYEIPQTASLLSRARVFDEYCEGAYVLPDNRLLVGWTDFTEFEVLTESEYLSALARRCSDTSVFDKEVHEETVDFFHKHLHQKHPA